jgi:hypothetical protein
MSDGGGLIPISDEQAKAIQEALKALQGVGGFLKETLGTVPQDLVGYLGRDWLGVRRAENLSRILEKARERLKARGAKAAEPASLSICCPSSSPRRRKAGTNYKTSGQDCLRPPPIRREQNGFVSHSSTWLRRWTH